MFEVPIKLMSTVFIQTLGRVTSVKQGESYDFLGGPATNYWYFQLY